MNAALTIIGLAMFIFIVVFSLKRAKEKTKAQQEEHEKIKEYGEKIKFFHLFLFLVSSFMLSPYSLIFSCSSC